MGSMVRAKEDFLDMHIESMGSLCCCDIGCNTFEVILYVQFHLCI
jgi:hypothetical protein